MRCIAALPALFAALVTIALAEPSTVAHYSADGSRATYTDPTVVAENGERVLLDHCREWSINCGQPAAEAYCKRQGYPFAKTFTLARGAGRTGVIGTGAICSGELCTGFREITCGNSDVLEPEPSRGPSPFGAAEPKGEIVPNRRGARVARCSGSRA